MLEDYAAESQVVQAQPAASAVRKQDAGLHAVSAHEDPRELLGSELRQSNDRVAPAERVAAKVQNLALHSRWEQLRRGLLAEPLGSAAPVLHNLPHVVHDFVALQAVPQGKQSRVCKRITTSAKASQCSQREARRYMGRWRPSRCAAWPAAACLGWQAE